MALLRENKRLELILEPTCFVDVKKVVKFVGSHFFTDSSDILKTFYKFQ